MLVFMLIDYQLFAVGKTKLISTNVVFLCNIHKFQVLFVIFTKGFLYSHDPVKQFVIENVQASLSTGAQ